METQDPRAWLESEFLARRAKNPSYSIRAFARLLDLPSGRVSQLLSRKRNFTVRLGEKIAERLNYDPRRGGQLHRAIQADRAARKGPHKPAAPVPEYRSLDMDVFQSIADPIHFSILSLAETRGFRDDAKYIAARLDITPGQARLATERLVRLGLLIRKNGLRLALQPGLATSHDVPSRALRESHKKVLSEAAEAIDRVPVEMRDVTSITMAIDPAKLPEAKRRLKEMRRSLSSFLEDGKKLEIYRLNVQLLPVSRSKEEN